jgi:hypothetical protein
MRLASPESRYVSTLRNLTDLDFHRRQHVKSKFLPKNASLRDDGRLHYLSLPRRLKTIRVTTTNISATNVEWTIVVAIGSAVMS